MADFCLNYRPNPLYHQPLTSINGRGEDVKLHPMARLLFDCSGTVESLQLPLSCHYSQIYSSPVQTYLSGPQLWVTWFSRASEVRFLNQKLGQVQSDIKSSTRGTCCHRLSLLGHGSWTLGLKGGNSAPRTLFHLKKPLRRSRDKFTSSPISWYIPTTRQWPCSCRQIRIATLNSLLWMSCSDLMLCSFTWIQDLLPTYMKN